LLDGDARLYRLRILRDVRDRLRDEVVDRRLDRVGQPIFRDSRELDRHGGTVRQGLKSGCQTAVGEDRRVYPARAPRSSSSACPSPASASVRRAIPGAPIYGPSRCRIGFKTRSRLDVPLRGSPALPSECRGTSRT
jgi:hypothetical protein